MRRALVFVALAARIAAAPLFATDGPGELTRLLGGSHTRSPVTEPALASIINRADREYTQMMLSGIASVPLLSDWVILVEYYAAQRERSPAETTALARRSAEKNLRRFRSRWNGLHHAVRDEQLSPDERLTLLYKLSVHHAYIVLRHLGYSSSNASSPTFWDLYARLVPHAKSEGYMTSRNAQVVAELQAEASRYDRLRRGLRRRDTDPSLALASVHAARWQLDRALESYRSGNPEFGQSLIDRGVRSFMEAFRSGVPPAEIGRILTYFKGPLTADALLDGERTFRAIVDESIDWRLSGANGRFARDVTLPGFYAFTPPDSPAEVTNTAEVTTVEVIGKRQKLNSSVFALEQLRTLVKEVSGEPVLRDYQGLVAMAAPLFHGRLHEILGADRYEHLFSLYRTDHSGLAKEDARRMYFRSGSAILTNASIREELFRSRDIIPVSLQLFWIDSPHLWWKGGDLWAGSAKQTSSTVSATDDTEARLPILLASLDRWRVATEWYIHTKEHIPDEIPSSLHLNVGACARNRYSLSEAARKLLREGGSHSSDRIDALLTTPLLDRKQQTIVDRILQPGYTAALTSLIEDSYRAVISRGAHRFALATPDIQNRAYAQYVAALSYLAVFKYQVHDTQIVSALLQQLLDEAPASREQFHIRGVVRSQILHDEAGAEEDFLQAEDPDT
ncbi:MAG: hypothetical protein ACE5IK_03480 [Acidobacteriota bacterium]